MHACPPSQRDRLVNNGSVAGKPTKLCERCGVQFTRTTPRGKPLTTQINAVLCYLSGLSMHHLACLLRVSAQSVLNWIRTCAKAYEEKPEPAGKTIVLQLAELWHSLKRKPQQLWIWKALEHDSGQRLDWACGRRDQATLKQLVDRLAPWDVQRYGTDPWVTYGSVIPQDKRLQSNTTTNAMERHHGRQCHRFRRFKRKSIIVSKSQEMADLTMALFARFWVNGNQDELLSLLG
jgi:insertion element IS1 protein InsB